MSERDDICAEIAARRARLHQLKHGPGFRLGTGPHAQAEARRRRLDIWELEERLASVDRGE